MKIFAPLLILLCVNILNAQHEWDKWYFGEGAGLDFNTNPPSLLEGGNINTREGCTTICNKETGDLLFYSDGTKVWNRNHDVMQNGDGLFGSYSSTQSAIVVPRPGWNNRYYIFTASDIASQKGYFYNEIDMSLDGGLGAIVLGEKNVFLFSKGTEDLVATKTCNGVDYWLITRQINSKDFYKFLITFDGITGPYRDPIGSYISDVGWNGAGFTKLSQDSKYLACSVGPKNKSSLGFVELYEFDNKTSIQNNRVIIDVLGRPTGIEFSPNGKFLYIATADYFVDNIISGIYQFDLSVSDIESTMITLFESVGTNFGAMQLTAHEEIYIVKEEGYNNGIHFLDLIRNPNEKGEMANYVEHGVNLGSSFGLFGLPTFISNINYTPPIGRINKTFCSEESITVNGTIYNKSNPNGVERLPITASTGCDSVVVINLTFGDPTEDYNNTICPGQSITIENTTFNQANPSGQIIIPNGSQGGCDSIINVNITFYATAISTSIFETELCHEDEITINGTIYNKDNSTGVETIPNGAIGGCDSVINVNIIFLEMPVGEYQNSYCARTDIEINGTIYNKNHPTGIEIIENGSSKGCDSTAFVNLTFNGIITELNPIFCPAEAIEINGTIYDETNPTGSEVFINGSIFGCDSTVEINLQFYNDTAFIDTVFCNLDDSLVLGNQIFTIDNPSGQFSIPNASFVGCDSIIDVNILFQIDSNIISDTLCWYDSLFVNGRYYTENNPFGVESMKTNDGCDSIIDLRLFFPYESVKLEIDAPDTVCYGETAILVANSNLEDPSYEWYKNDSLICLDCPSINSKVIKEDIFKLFAEDKYGCELFLDQHRIHTTISYDVYFPNVITPNGDGINDKFTVFGNKKVEHVISMTIYDRWGEELYIEKDFPMNDLHHGWDGFFDRRVMQPGVYVYVIFVEFIDGTVKQYAGDLTIIL